MKEENCEHGKPLYILNCKNYFCKDCYPLDTPTPQNESWAERERLKKIIEVYIQKPIGVDYESLIDKLQDYFSLPQPETHDITIKSESSPTTVKMPHDGTVDYKFDEKSESEVVKVKFPQPEISGEWEKDFDKQIEKAHDIFYGEGDGYDELKKWLKTDENKLFAGYPYPETAYEIDPDKLKEFIQEIISSHNLKLAKKIESLIKQINETTTHEDTIPRESEATYWSTKGERLAKQEIVESLQALLNNKN